MIGPMFETTMNSPLGQLTLRSDGKSITALAFPNHSARNAAGGAERPADPLLDEAVRQLKAYFDGSLQGFDLPLAPQGTEFQRRVWQELRTIPLAEVISYGELARRIGRPTASRAVGAANGRNPIAIVIPCHRVIGADGSLTGFGGGLDTKQWLIHHEASRAPTGERVDAGAAVFSG